MGRTDISLHLVTLRELCEISGAHADFILEMVDFGILEPAAGHRAPTDRGHWQFGAPAVRRSRRAVSLTRDFGINIEGLSLVLDLLDELDTNRNRIRVLQRLLNSQDR